MLSKPLPRRPWALLGLALLAGLLAVGCADAAERSDQASDALRTPAEWMALPDVRRASYALQDAAARVEETDARLARQMAQTGLALTDEQRQRYATAFFALPDVSETHRNFITAAANLDRELSTLVATHLPEVMRTVWGGVLGADRYGPSELYADYKLLAGSPVATGALAFAVRVAAQDRAYANVRIPREQVEREILAPALPAALVEQLLLTGSTRSALDALAAKTSIQDVTGAARVDPPTARVLAELALFASAPDAATFTARLDTPMGRAETACGAVVAIWEVGGGQPSAAAPQLQQALLVLLRGGPGAVGALARAVNVLRVSVLGLGEAELAVRVASFAARVGAGTGVVLGLFKLLGAPGQLGDIDAWNANLSDKVQIVGDLVGISAGVVGLLATGPAAPALAGLALGISIFATLLRDHEIAVQDAHDKEVCLARIGLDPALVATLVRSSPNILQAMHDDAGFTPAQIQWAAQTSPHLVIDDIPHLMPFHGLSVSRAVFGLTPTQSFQLLNAVVGQASSAEDREFMLLHFLVYIDADPSWSSSMSRATALAWLGATASETSGFDAHDSAMWTAIFVNARSYLAAR
ncbi:MAG TPA: hypothetical protein VLT33_18995 [Labilithrix sp.]|nr:hypothetical protein [Labilithrix sp.]